MNNYFIIDLGEVKLKNYHGFITDKISREFYDISAKGAGI